MQLEELQRRWTRLDEKLDHTLKLQRELLRQSVLPATRRRMKQLAIWPALDIVFCVIVLLLAGSFLGDHWRVWSLTLPALVVMIAAGLLLGDSIRQLVRVAEIDWNGVVVDIQGTLSEYRKAKIVQFKWIVLASPLVGFCVLIVGVQSLLDQLPEPRFILDQVSPGWVVGNYAFGVLFLLFGHLLIGYLATRFRGRSWWHRMACDVSGVSIRRAEEEVQRWAILDQEMPRSGG